MLICIQTAGKNPILSCSWQYTWHVFNDSSYNCNEAWKVSNTA